MKKKSVYLILAGIFLSAFVIFSMFIKKFNPAYFDFDTTVRIQNHTPKRLDSFLSFLSLIGSFEVMSVFLILTIAIFSRKIKSIFLIIFYGAGHLLEIFGKVFLNHPGPPFLFFRYDLGLYFPSSYVQTGSSYPSGHSFRTIFLLTVLTFFIFKSKKIKPATKFFLISAFTIISAVMLFSRISLGEHWTSDVVGGTLLGLGMGGLAIFFI